MIESYAREAKTYAKVGLAFYLIMSSLAGLALLAVTMIFFARRGFFISIFIFVIPLIGFSVLFGLTYYSWFTVKQIDRGRYESARTNCLILGILGLVFGMVFGGIFFLLSYNSLGQVVHTSYLKACPNCGRGVSEESIFCPSCGKKLVK